MKESDGDESPKTALTLRVRQGGLDLDREDERLYAPLGYFICAAGKLEFALDEFAFKVAKIAPSLAKRISMNLGGKKRKSNLPYKYNDKIEFCIDCVVLMSDLRTIIGQETDWSVNAMGYAMEEVFSVRNKIAHSDIYNFESSGTRTEYTMVKFDRSSDHRREFARTRYILTNSYLDHLFYYINYHVVLLIGFQRILDGVDIAGKRRSVLDGRARLKDFIRNSKRKGVEVPLELEALACL